MSKSRVSTAEIRGIVAGQRAAKSAAGAARIARAARRFDPARCDCGTPAGFHPSDCRGHTR